MKKGIIITGLVGTGLLIDKFVVQPHLTKKRKEETEELMAYYEKRAEEAVRPLREGTARMEKLNKEMEENLEYHRNKLDEIKKRNE